MRLSLPTGVSAVALGAALAAMPGSLALAACVNSNGGSATVPTAGSTVNCTGTDAGPINGGPGFWGFPQRGADSVTVNLLNGAQLGPSNATISMPVWPFMAAAASADQVSVSPIYLGNGTNVNIANGARLISAGKASNAIETGNSLSLLLQNGGTIQGGVYAGGNSRLTIGGTMALPQDVEPSSSFSSINLYGRGNQVTLLPGFSIAGNVYGGSSFNSDPKGTPAPNTLALGGEGTATFDVGKIAPAQRPSEEEDFVSIAAVAPTAYQYYNFDAFQKTGTSNWTLTGTTTALTPWTIDQGTLTISQDANLGDAAGGLTFNGGTLATTTSFTTERTVTLIAGGGTFAPAAGTTLTYAGTIGGTGALTLAGPGTLALAGTNTYSGATFVNGGTLLGGAANTFSATSATSIASGGTLDLGGYAQTINTVALAGGTLRNGALTGAVTSAGGTIDTLGGSASLTTTGGTTTAIGTSTYTGATAVNGGNLVIQGTITASNITVGNGGVLSGTGKIGDPTIGAGGTLAPGSAANPTGTLTIVGPLGFAPGSFYAIAITPTQNSRTNVVGTTTIAGGTVAVTPGAGTYGIRQYTILNATGGVAGAFAGVTSAAAFAFLTPSLSYDANNVYLNIAPKGATAAGTPNYTSAASNQNQLSVAQGLTQAGIQSGGRGQVLRALNQLTVPQARAAFDSLSGEGVTAAQNVAFRSAQLFASAMFDQTTFYAGGGATNSITLTAPQFGLLGSQPVRELADLPARGFRPSAPAPANRTWRAWATGFGGVENISGNRSLGSASQRNDLYGGAVGVDYQLTPNYLIGVAVGGSNGNFRVDQRGTTGSTTGGHIAIYDLYELGNWYGASSSSFSYFGNQTTRFTSGFGGLGTEQNRGNFNSNEFRSRIEIGRHFSSLPLLGGLPTIAGFGTITPFVAIELASLRSNGFTETPLKGGPGLFRLNVSGQSASSAPGFVGLRFQQVTPFGGMVLSPTLQVAYVHEFAPYRNQIGTLASLPGSTFLVDGARPARDAAQVKAGAELALGPHSAIFANFDGEFSGINQLYAGKGGFRYVW